MSAGCVVNGYVVLAGMFVCATALSVYAWWQLRRELRRARIQAERDAANRRTWAHVVDSRAADWAAWESELASR